MLNYFSKMVLRLECVQILDIFRFLGKVNCVHKVILFCLFYYFCGFFNVQPQASDYLSMPRKVNKINLLEGRWHDVCVLR